MECDKDYKLTMCLEKDHVEIRFPYNAALVQEIKKIPGRTFRDAGPGKKFWEIPLVDGAVESLLLLGKQHGFQIDPNITIALKKKKKNEKETLAASRATDANIEINNLGGTLRPFQKAAVAYAKRRHSCFFADEMGLGKTIEALATIKYLNKFPAVVVCPASLKLNWEKETQKWLPDKSIQILEGRKPKIKYKADVTIINYDILANHVAPLLKQARGSHPKIKAVIFDESHYMKNSQAKRTKAGEALAQGISANGLKLCLTGTPVTNSPHELISQLKILDKLNEFGGWYGFARRYCAAYKGRFGWDLSGAAHLDELNNMLRKTCYIRRRKEDVLSELPPKQRTLIPIIIDNQEEYDRVEEDVITWLGERAANDETFLESIASLSVNERKAAMQKRAATAEQKAEKAERLVRIEMLKQVAAQGKISQIVQFIKEFVEQGEKVVVFANHRNVQQDLRNAFPGCASISGRDSQQKRQDSIDRFQNDRNCMVAICSLKAAGIGITLTASSNVVFTELGWTPAEHDQAEDRCHRIGQNDSVNAWYIIGKDTIDESIAKLIEEKRSIVSGATEGNNVKAQSTLSGIISALLRKK